MEQRNNEYSGWHRLSERGKSFRADSIRLGYLRQEAVPAFANQEKSVYAEMLAVFAPYMPYRQRWL
ncbi:MAG: hypothetical protein R3C14_14580 [Caldilineaceae bacterium]